MTRGDGHAGGAPPADGFDRRSGTLLERARARLAVIRPTRQIRHRWMACANFGL